MRGKEYQNGLSPQALRALALVTGDRAEELAQANTEINTHPLGFRTEVQRRGIALDRLTDAVHTIQEKVINPKK